MCFFTKSRCSFWPKLTFTSVLQRLVNSQPCYWAANSESTKANWLSHVVIFQKFHFSKNTARDRASPKQSLLVLFITSMCITFCTLMRFRKFTGTLFIMFKHYSSNCVFSSSRCSFWLAFTTTPVSLFSWKNFLLYYNAQWTFNLVTGRATLRVESPMNFFKIL